MLLQNTLFDPVEITTPVLRDCLTSAPVQRLHGVLQHGISGLIGLTPAITRFDHSVGAMLLVRRMGGSEKEQIAALLHDVSHTAFSHVIDHVFDSAASQAYHEHVKEAYLLSSELPAILATHGFDYHDFLVEDDYPLLEQPAPRLCADRIDYFLRDAVCFDLITPTEVSQLFNHLTIVDERLALDDLPTARWMGETFMRCDNYSWSNYHEVGLYELTAMALRYAFEHDILQKDDIWGTDASVWQKMHERADQPLQQLLAAVHPDVRFVEDADNPDFVLSTKIRTIDPDVLIKDEVKPLSEWDPDFGRQRERYVASKNGLWNMRRIR